MRLIASPFCMDVFAGEQSHFNTDGGAILFIITVCYRFFLSAKVEEFTWIRDIEVR